MSVAYWVNTFRVVRDPGRVAEYAAAAASVMEAHGGRFLARGMPTRAFEHGVLERTTIIEFPSVADAVAAYESAEYQRALAVLGDAADRDIRIIEAAAAAAAAPHDRGPASARGPVDHSGRKDPT